MAEMGKSIVEIMKNGTFVDDSANHRVRIKTLFVNYARVSCAVNSRPVADVTADTSEIRTDRRVYSLKTVQRNRTSNDKLSFNRQSERNIYVYESN